MVGPNIVLPKGIKSEGRTTARACVVPGAGESVKLPAGPNDPDPVGIVLDGAEDGQMATVCLVGIAEAVAAGPIRFGKKVRIAGADGKLEEATGPGPHHAVGTAFSDAAADNDFFTVLLERTVIA
jgi:hypothetical protein